MLPQTILIVLTNFATCNFVAPTKIGFRNLENRLEPVLFIFQATPTIMSRPMTSDMSISGVRLKKIDTTFVGTEVQSKGRISSGHTAAHWGQLVFFLATVNPSYMESCNPLK